MNLALYVTLPSSDRSTSNTTFDFLYPVGAFDSSMMYLPGACSPKLTTPFLSPSYPVLALDIVFLVVASIRANVAPVMASTPFSSTFVTSTFAFGNASFVMFNLIPSFVGSVGLSCALASDNPIDC